MKTIISYLPTDHKAIGLTAAIGTTIPQLAIWNPQTDSLQDLLYKTRPFLLILHERFISQQALEQLTKNYNVIVISDKLHIYRYDSYVGSIPFSSCANTLQYNSGVYSEDLSSDILYISNQDLSPNYLGVLHSLDISKYRVKMCGPIRLPFLSYVGAATVKSISDMIKSTKMILDINANCIYDAIYNKRPYLAINNADLFGTIEKILENPDKYTINNEPHSYIDLWQDILRTLKIPIFDQKIQEIKNKLCWES